MLSQDNKEDAEKALNLWIEEALDSNEKEWRPYVTAFTNWKERKRSLGLFALPKNR